MRERGLKRGKEKKMFGRQWNGNEDKKRGKK